jgi:hypothetical protein
MFLFADNRIGATSVGTTTTAVNELIAQLTDPARCSRGGPKKKEMLAAA